MSEVLTTSSSPVAPAFRWPGEGRSRDVAPWLRDGAVGLAVVGATAVAVTYAPIPRLLVVGIAACVVLALAIVASPMVAAVLLGISIPEIQDVTGGHLGVHVAASDVLLVLVCVAVVLDGLRNRGAVPALRALRPVAFPLVQYGWLIGVLLVLHLGLGSAAKSAQRIELYALPTVVGAYLALHGRHMVVLRGYVLASAALAVIWPTGALSSQFDKNPVGGFIASAILLLLAVRGLRRLMWLMPVLLVGLGLAASRGAIVGLAVGMVVIGIAHVGASRRNVLAGMLLLAVTGFVVFQFLPASTTARLTNFSASGNSSSSWAIRYRNDYYREAVRLIDAHPLIGVGVGNYHAGSVAELTATTDPHDVILLEAAEGGYLFALSFVLLIAGTAFAMWRLRRFELAPAAAGILLATAAHGLVDVYWVRGTPILGWLLVGMVCGLIARARMASGG